MSIENEEKQGNLEETEEIRKKNNDKEPIQEENEAILQKEVHDALVSKNGLIADKFDKEPFLPATEEEFSEFDGQEEVRVSYGFTAEEVKPALVLFQKDTIYKKNIIYSLIIAVLFVTYLIQVLGGNQTKFALFMCILTFSVLGMVWYFPLMHIRSTVKSIASQEYKEDYLISVYASAIVVGEGTTKNVFYFKDNQIKCWETADLFVLGYAKQRIFVVPKRCSGEKTTRMAEMLKNGLVKGYKVVL